MTYQTKRSLRAALSRAQIKVSELDSGNDAKRETLINIQKQNANLRAELGASAARASRLSDEVARRRTHEPQAFIFGGRATPRDLCYRADLNPRASNVFIVRHASDTHGRWAYPGDRFIYTAGDLLPDHALELLWRSGIDLTQIWAQDL